MQYCAESQRLYTLQDATGDAPLAQPLRRRNCIRSWDAVAHCALVATHDFFESYDLVCFHGIEGARDVIVAGAAHMGAHSNLTFPVPCGCAAYRH